MMNDILEQVVEDYFRSKGYFTQHNVKYRPNKVGPQYTVYSDVDVVGVHPKKRGRERVVVVNCKSWQVGLNIDKTLKTLDKNPNKKIAGKEQWKKFREISNKVWAEALKKKIFNITGQKSFKFYLAVTKYKGNKDSWEKFPLFKKNLIGCDIEVIDIKAMLLDTYKSIGRTPLHSELGRLLQLIKASGGKIEYIEKNKKSKN